MKVNHFIFIALGFALGLSPVSAQTSMADLFGDHYTILKDVSYGPDAEQNMDIYLSTVPNPEYVKYTVVFVHGGGFYVSDKTKEERYIRPYLEKGFNVVNLNYRLKRGVPVATEDLTIALNFLKENNAEYKLKLNRLILTGFSAGAQIATNVGLARNNRDYPNRLDKGIKTTAVINFSGPVDQLDVIEKVFTEHEVEIMQTVGRALFTEYEGYTPGEILAVYEPITWLDKKDPAVFLWYGAHDDQVPAKTFTAFASLLNENTDKNVVVFDPDAGHSPSNETLARVYQKIFEFIGGL